MKVLRIYVTAALSLSAAFAYISFDRAKIWKSTVTLFEDVIKKQPRFIEGYDKLSEHYFIKAQHSSAQHRLAQDSMAQDNLARDMVFNYRNAIRWAKVTLKMHDNYPGEYLRLVRCHLELNEPDSAMMYAPQAVKSAGNMQQILEACSIKGYLDMRAGRYADAVADYDMLLKYNPNSVGDLFQRGVAKMSMQQYEPALADFGRVLQLQPNEANAHVNVGRIYAGMNRVELAMEHINRALQINPEHPDACFMHGVLYFRLGQRAAARADFSKAHSLGHPEAAAWLAQ